MYRKAHHTLLKSALPLCILLLVSVIALLSPSAEAGDGTIRKAVHPVKDRYIVKLNDSLEPATVRSLASMLASQHGGKLDYVWDSVVPSFSIEMPEAAAEALARHPLVHFVEEAAEWRLSQVQFNAPFHLDRIDRRFLQDLNGTYEQGCVTTTVYAYILDTGVRASHHEFWTSSVNPVSRVLPGQDFITPSSPSETNPCSGYTVFDDPQPCNSQDRECLGGGHGTAVASILGGLENGVAKGVKIIPVRVMPCAGSGDSPTIVKGLQWVYQDKTARNAARIQAGLPVEPAVLNMSNGTDIIPGSPQTETEYWINRLIDDLKITVVVSANNGEIDVAGSSPARVPNVITVAGSTTADKRWHCNSANAFEVCSHADVGSNYGSGVDIFAPAQNIRSAGIKEPLDPADPYYQFNTCCKDSDMASRQGARSGTSFAAPIVAGVAARILMGSGASLTPAQVWEQILIQASGDSPSVPPAVLQPPGGDPDAGALLSPNRMIFRQGATRCRSVG